MKKIRLFVISIFLLMIPFINVNAEGEKVKVYMFEAGGCPYCESQEEYLTGLDSYGVKFELIKKELYIDHVKWEQGKDYDLGVKVANGFIDAGFKDASYQGTPFVVISDIYAVAGYSKTLESVINEAYEKGDKDIVGCYEKGNTNCLDHLKSNTNTNGNVKTNNTNIIIINMICCLVMIVVYLLKSTKDKNEIIEILKK